jgi:hypothetical protein
MPFGWWNTASVTTPDLSTANATLNPVNVTAVVGQESEKELQPFEFLGSRAATTGWCFRRGPRLPKK